MMIATKLFLVRLLLLVLAVSSNGFAQNDPSKAVSIKIAPIPSYPSGDEVEVKYTITNGTVSDLKMSSTSGGFDFKIILEGPDGKRVTPYTYHVEPRGGKFLINVVNSGESIDQYLELSGYFPFNEVGMYRCILTKRVYGDGDRPANFHEELKGERIDVTSEPFEFRVESPSKETLRSFSDPITGVMPGDELDGLTDKLWYARPAKPSVLSWEGLKARKVIGLPVWLVCGGIAAAALLAWLVIKNRK